MNESKQLTKIKKSLKKYRDLHKASLDLRDDLLMRGTKEKNGDGSNCVVVDVSQGRWYMFNEALKSLKSE